MSDFPRKTEFGASVPFENGLDFDSLEARLQAVEERSLSNHLALPSLLYGLEFSATADNTAQLVVTRRHGEAYEPFEIESISTVTNGSGVTGATATLSSDLFSPKPVTRSYYNNRLYFFIPAYAPAEGPCFLLVTYDRTNRRLTVATRKADNPGSSLVMNPGFPSAQGWLHLPDTLPFGYGVQDSEIATAS